MSILNPIQAAKEIKDKYIEYLLTTFKLDDKNIESQFRDELYKNGKLSKGPYLEVSNSFKKGKSINELIDSSILVKEFNNFKSPSFPFNDKNNNIYFHQEQAIEKASNQENIIVSTGTGSGKTESFLIPIINHLLKEKEEGTLSPGVRALILYPMNALVNDQIKRLRTLLKDCPEITFGKFTGETDHKEKDARKTQEGKLEKSEIIPNEIISREEMRNNPPQILITNYAMLEYLMLRPEDNVFFDGPSSKFWKFIVLDEAHTYKGALGIEVSMLLRRLKETIKKTDNIQFILTSASLGRGPQDNPDIVKFAENLTGEPFKEENIIGATRVTYKNKGQETLSFQIYTEIYNNLDNKEKIINTLEKYNIIHYFENIENQKTEEILYNLALIDNNFYVLRNFLDEPKEIIDIYNNMNLDDIDILFKFINVLSKAKKDEIELFKAKYHYFFKALEGGFLSLIPNKRFYLNRMEEVEINDEKLKVFEISTCKYCNEIYLVGELVSTPNKNYKILNQKKNHMSEEIGIDLDYFLLKSSIITKNEDEDYLEDEDGKEEEYKLCGKCGGVFSKNSLDGKCECAKAYQVDVIRIIRDKRKKKALHTCRACGSTNPSSSILKRFIIGADGATAALGTALHESLPDIKIVKKDITKNNLSPKKSLFSLKSKKDVYNTEKTEETIRQFLVFSDSRQSAAYYATYMEESYNKFLRKRVIYEVISKSNKDLSIPELINQVTAIFEKNNIFSQADCEKEAYKSVFYELFSIDRRYSLEGLGLVQFKLEFDLDEGLGLEERELKMFLQESCNIFKYKGAIKYDYNIPKADKEYFSYSSKECYINLEDSNTKENIFSWKTSRNNNSRIKYIQKLFDYSIEESNELLDSIWEEILDNGGYLIGSKGNYQLKIDKIKICSGSKIDWYYCDCCKKITPNNVKDICPTFGCDGILEKVNPDEIYKNNHYRNLSKNLLIKSFKINEHTAQLDNKSAYDIQEKFTNKKINVLSCSTTFEMGVDVGELETVFMRNMPPSPANYSQRAGRAGRRGSSSAFTITFCSQKSHDFTFYKNPLEMIKGMIPPPKFEIDNEKIILRHIYAICFGHFWKKNIINYGEGKVKNVLQKNIIDNFKTYLNTKPKEIENFLLNILDSEIQKKLDIFTWKWLDNLLHESSDGALYRVQKEFFSEIQEIDDAREEIVKKLIAKEKLGKDQSNLHKIDGMKANIESKTVINYFAQKNLLPRYGFPVDTVELHSDEKDGIKLSRDLSLAISEYAPGGQVIANGKIFTSQYIKKVPSLNWKIYNYGICKECKTLNHKIDTTIESDNTSCINCGNNLKLEDKYLIPEFGFRVDVNLTEKAGVKKPKKLYSTEVYAIENKNAVKIAEKEINLKNGKVILKSFKDEEMGIISQNRFFICETCGYGEKATGNINKLYIKNEHKNHSGYLCNSSLKPYNLGHRFKTDIVTISFISLNNFQINESILFGLLEGISSVLNIDRSDISGCIKKVDNRNNIVIYDTVPGGAGHVKRLLENDTNIIKVLENTYGIVSDCECGEETSCYSCLRDYSNQKYHEELIRGDVISFIRKLIF